MEETVKKQAEQLAQCRIEHTLDDSNLPKGMSARVLIDESSWGEILLQLRLAGFVISKINREGENGPADPV